MVKKGFKLIAIHFFAVILSILVLSIFGGVIKTRSGSSIIWSGFLLVYIWLMYSEGWNMASIDRKPYYEIKPSIIRPIKASLITFIIPLILVIINFIPMNNWRPFALQYELKSDNTYTVLLNGADGVFVDDFGIVKLPEESSVMYQYETPENLLSNNDFENSENWEMQNVTLNSNVSRSGKSSVKFNDGGKLVQSFTVKEDGVHHISGYYKGKGALSVTLLGDEKEITTYDVAKDVAPLNERIFTVGSNIWYLPLYLLYNNGEGDITPFNVLYLALVLPFLVTIGYMVGKTGFSFTEKYMEFKAKQLQKKKAAAEAEEKAIREERKRFKK